jgi:hypothetical protein
MMHLARTPLIFVIVVLSSVGFASAECAWVLWSSLSELDPLNPPRKFSEADVAWRIHRAVGSQNECIQTQTGLLARWRDEAQRKARLRGPTASIWEKSSRPRNDLPVRHIE